jgi:tRNA threonylcarbamoyladenosine biosynthesis protein TsaB
MVEKRPMRGLAIETSGRVGSIALVEDGIVLDERTFPHGLKHAAGLLPLIADACAARDWQPIDLRELYVSVGPGSFTGLRIGVTLAKTLAFATDARIVAVRSTNVLVENLPAEARHAVVVLDAKRQQIFTARFERRETDGHWELREPPHVEGLADVLARSPRPVHLIGEGIPYHRQFIPVNDASVIESTEETWRSRAAVVARLGAAMAHRDEFTDALVLSPLYIRRPEAEEKADAARGAMAPTDRDAAHDRLT